MEQPLQVTDINALENINCKSDMAEQGFCIRCSARKDNYETRNRSEDRRFDC